ncbi:MAG TPA: glycosyltransferase [Solirubrobacteraceae bacterium]|nr:glycosyltransferase [Solirubrobacteraceae bacterium]
MRVLFLHQQPCMRAMKYAVGFRSAGARLELGFAYRGRTLSEFYGSGDELFDRWWRIGPDLGADLQRVIADWQPDLVHSHNLPDLLTVLALEITEGRVPVIHDVHDMNGLRRTPYEDGFPDAGEPAALERAATEGSAALITVSDELLDEIADRYELPARTRTFPNYALARDLPALPPADRPAGDPPRLVYQGTLSCSHGHYDLREIFAAIVAAGVTLDVYPTRDEPAYRRLAASTAGLRLHETRSPSALMRELAGYDFGWAGFNAGLNAAHLDTALPNKAFEYVAAGLPVLTLDHRALASFVVTNGLGLRLDGVEGLGARLRALDLPALRGRVAAARHGLTVEANIGEVLDLYDETVGAAELVAG